MECKKAANLKSCNCTYSCSKKGMCCECINYHISQRALPAVVSPRMQKKHTIGLLKILLNW